MLICKGKQQIFKEIRIKSATDFIVFLSQLKKKLITHLFY